MELVPELQSRTESFDVEVEIYFLVLKEVQMMALPYLSNLPASAKKCITQCCLDGDVLRESIWKWKIRQKGISAVVKLGRKEEVPAEVVSRLQRFRTLVFLVRDIVTEYAACSWRSTDPH